VPQLTNYDSGSTENNSNLQYSVDVALNGQQFTGKPVAFRFYDIKFTHIEPEFGLHEGGTDLHLKGDGLYDSQIKRIKFSTASGGEREVTADWDRKLKCLRCIVPPYTWLFGASENNDGDEETKEEKFSNEPINLQVTYNNQEWI